MKFKNYLFLCIVVLLAVTACKKSSTPKPGTSGSTSTQIDTDVYVAGIISGSNDNGVAAYWKNGQITKVSDKTKNCAVTNMAVYGSTVYVCGYYAYKDVSGVEHKTAVYWVSTPTSAPVEHLLTAEAVANGITADANGVYISGTINEDATNTNHHAALWINDVDHVTNLTPNIYDSNGYGVTLNGGNVYVVGDSGNDATYWVDVNNTITPNTLDKTGVSSGSAHAIMFKGSDMYVAGQTFNGTSFAATHWLNNHTPERLTDNSDASSISTNSKGDIYVGGTSINSDNNELAAYWKNGGITTYGNGTGGAINAMTLVGDDLYMAGGYYTNGVGYSEGYWKNGVFKPRTDAYTVNAIVVITHPH